MDRSESISWKVYTILIAIVVFAFAIRLGITFKYQGLNSSPKEEANSDQIEYELFAYQLAIGNGFAYGPERPTGCRAPGTSFTLLPIYWMFGRSFLAARLWYCFLSAITCLCTWWCAKQVFGIRVGLVAAALLAIYPGHFYYCMHFLSEVPFGLALILACGLGIVAARSNYLWWGLAAGLLWGFTILIRPNMSLGLLLFTIVLMLTLPNWKERLAKVTIIIGAAMLVVTPWMLRNYQVMNKFTICTMNGGVTFWGAYNKIAATDPNLIGYWVVPTDLVDEEHPFQGDELERESAAYSYGREFIRNHPELIPRMVLHRILRLGWVYPETTNRTVEQAFRIGWLSLAPFVLLGGVVALRHHTQDTLLLGTCLMATLITAILFYGCGRFRDGLAPVLVIFAAYGLEYFVVSCLNWLNRS